VDDHGARRFGQVDQDVGIAGTPGADVDPVVAGQPGTGGVDRRRAGQDTTPETAPRVRFVGVAGVRFDPVRFVVGFTLMRVGFTVRLEYAAVFGLPNRTPAPGTGRTVVGFVTDIPTISGGRTRPR
jgi:hypothetical protein